jgi:AraC-like DNA-binding protein
LNSIVKKYDFFKTKYGDELLIDLIRLESLEKYITTDEPHYLSYYDITLITGGKGFFSIDHSRYPIEPGTIVFSSSGQVRCWDIELLPTGYVLIFEEEFLSCFLNDSQFISGLRYFNTYSFPPKLSLSPQDVQYLIKLEQDIEQEIRTFNTTDKHILRALLFHVLVWLNRKYSDVYPAIVTTDSNRHVRLFVNLVNREFAHHHTVSYYADALSITAGHLMDLCKSHLGISAKQYIQNRIIIEAKRLLLFSDLQVSEIALRLNFEDTSYFVRQFKHSTGATPLSFRKAENP